jgi:hypothetical protein
MSQMLESVKRGRRRSLLKFFNFLEAEIGSNLNEPADRLTSILKALVSELLKKLDRRVLNAEIQ